MADNKIALDILINTDKANLTLGELEDGLAAANEELRNLPRGSKAFNDLAQEITLANKEVKNLELSMEALDNEQVASELGSVAGAVGDVTTSMMLLSGGNKSLEEMAANIEMAIGVSMGLKGAIEGISSANKLWNNLIKTNTTVQKLATLATTNFGKALIATGIGAIIALIGTLIVYWDDLTEAIGMSTAAQRLNNDVKTEALNQVADELSAADKLKKKLDDETLSREDKNKAIIELQDEYPDLLANIDAESASLDDVNKALELNTRLLYLRAQQEAIAELRAEEFKNQLKEQADAQTGANVGLKEYLLGLSTGIDQQTFATAQSYENIKASKAQVAALDDLDNSIQSQIDSLLEQGAVGKKENEESKKIDEDKKKRSQARKARRDKETKEIEDAEKKRLEAEKRRLQEKLKAEQDWELQKQSTLDAIAQAEEDALTTSIQKEINAVTDKYFTLIEAAKQYGLDTAILEEEQQRQIKEIQDRYDEEAKQKKKEADDEEKAADEEKHQKKIDLINNTLQSTMNSLDLLSQMSSQSLENELKNAEGNEQRMEQIRKKAFERDKKLNIAKALIGGAQAVMQALASAPPPFNFINAGIVGAATLAQLNAIKNSKFEGGGSSPSLGSAGQSASGASGGVDINAVSNTSTVLGNQKVVVAEGDITNVQQKVMVAENYATF